MIIISLIISSIISLLVLFFIFYLHVNLKKIFISLIKKIFISLIKTLFGGTWKLNGVDMNIILKIHYNNYHSLSNKLNKIIYLSLFAVYLILMSCIKPQT